MKNQQVNGNQNTAIPPVETGNVAVKAALKIVTPCQTVDSNEGLLIEDADGEKLLEMSCLGEDCPEERLAEEIVKAVNSHDALVEALRGLFEHCAMVHKHWGEGSNQKEADAAIDAARAALALVG